MQVRIRDDTNQIIAIVDASDVDLCIQRLSTPIFSDTAAYRGVHADLDDVKAAAIALVEQKAGEFHALIVGTNDPRRAERFALNLELAQKLLAGTATAVEQQALQMQLDANQQAGHPVLTGKTLEQFAQWIVQFKTYTTLGSGLIEATLIKGRAAINAAQSIESIEQIKAQLAAQAQAAFEQLQAQLAG